MKALCSRQFWQSYLPRLALGVFMVVGSCIGFAHTAAAVTVPDTYPLVANYFLDPIISDAEARELAKWDVIVIGMETQYTSPNAFRIMKEINPDIVTLAYVASEEINLQNLSLSDSNNTLFKFYNQFNTKPEVWLERFNNTRVSIWPGTNMVNVSNSTWQNALTGFMTNEVLKKNSDKWSGVFYDNCFNDISWISSVIDVNNDGVADAGSEADTLWKNGMNDIMRKTRELNPDSAIVCNSSGQYYTYINGRLIEAFPNDNFEGWPAQMDNYFKVVKEGKSPSIVIVNTVANSFDSANYRLMRYNLTSTLMGDGFASFDESIASHDSLWWYDEYEAALGKPIAGAYNVENNKRPSEGFERGVWRRNYELGTVIVNSTNETKHVVLEQGYEKILGTQDSIVNNGRVVGSVTIGPNDGIILLGRLAQVRQAPYVNGTLANVFNARGGKKRNAFFTYDSTYSGNDTIVTYPAKNAVVVADNTYVTVYKNGRQTAKFAPYGTGFRGGITLAVDKFKPKRTGVQIVTGMRSGGAQVKVYNLQGKQLRPECFPFGEQFQGGVNVAIGDVLKKSRGKEIVVGAGSGGGPQVIVLNTNCQVLKNFFAYDSGLRSGVKVAAGNADNKGLDDIVTIPGAGAAPHVRLFNARGKELRPGWFALNKSDRRDRQISISDVDQDGTFEIIVMSFSVFAQ